MPLTVIVGGGPSGRAAAALLPEARLIARPNATAWHADPGRLWIENASGVATLDFDRLLLCADEPMLLLALGCAFAEGRPAIDPYGATSATGIYAAGAILGAETPDEAARQGRIAAQALLGVATEGCITITPRRVAAAASRLDPDAMATLLESPPGPARTEAILAQRGLRGTHLPDTFLPTRPVGLAALAALAPTPPMPRPTQQDESPLR